MRASTDQVRDLTLDVVDGARKRASGVVSQGAERVASTFDGAASTLGDGVERLADRVPTVAVSARRPRQTHRLRTVLVVTALLVVVVAVARKVLGGTAGETAPGPARAKDEARAPQEDDDEVERDPLGEANVAEG
jgi:hypothetical protein